MNDRQSFAHAGLRIDPRKGVGGTAPEGVFQGGPLCPFIKRLGHLGPIHREFTSHSDHVDGETRVLADQKILFLGNLKVLEDSSKNLFCRFIGLPLIGLFQGLFHIWWQEFQCLYIQFFGHVFHQLIAKLSHALPPFYSMRSMFFKASSRTLSTCFLIMLSAEGALPFSMAPKIS